MLWRVRPAYSNLYHYAGNNPVKYTDPDGRKTQRSIRRNSNNKYRVGSNKEDWKSDKFGREILLHYLFGNGKELVCDSKAWADYMKANKSLTEQIEVAISKNYDNLGMEPGSKIDFDIQINAEIENGESITGYNYLHGTNETVGGLQLKGSILRNKDGTITVSYDAQWNDIMDPNPKYKTDIAKAKFAKIISFGRCKDYVIRVKWDNVYIANSQKGVENE